LNWVPLSAFITSGGPYCWNDVLPLLGKYKATAMLCGNDPDYERCEPTPDKGCTQIVIGCSGKDAYRFGRGSGHTNGVVAGLKGHPTPAVSRPDEPAATVYIPRPK
jgi:hypothetical protein